LQLIWVRMGHTNMKIAIRHITLFILLLAYPTCKREYIPSARCQLTPETGPCRAYFIKYYYDRGEKRCKEFVWGGCDGVVPFHTLEECRACTPNE
jgi:hypothetical protein